MMVDVEHVLTLDRRQMLAGASPIAHVAEDVQRVGGQIGGQLPRDQLGIRQETKIARHAVLLKVRDPLAHAFERQSERKSRSERVAVGLHVAHHDEGAAPAQLGNDLGGRRASRRAIDHSLAFGVRAAASRSVFASAIARSAERSSTKMSSGV